MANFQYKTASGDTWTDVPITAYHGSFAGSLDVTYPIAEDVDGSGKPCGAIGPRSIRLQSQVMTASGFDWWQDFFSDEYDLEVEFWLTARNARTNLWSKYTGWLLRPIYERVQIGSGSLSTLYNNVEIIVDLLADAT